MMRNLIAIAWAIAAAASFSSVASAQEMTLAKERAKAIFADAQACAKQMATIGFFVDEIRTEIDLTPKIEVYFRDGGGASHAMIPSGLSTSCQGIAKLLLLSRDVQYGGYRLKGVKATFMPPKVELIHTVVP